MMRVIQISFARYPVSRAVPARFAQVPRTGGDALIPKEFQKSNLALELKSGKKRLEGALQGLSDEQCERAGATRFGSVMDVLSEIVTAKFLARMEVSDRLPSLPIDHLANPKDKTSGAPETGQPTTAKSVKKLLPVRWRTVRAWKSRVVIAERVEDLPLLNA